MLQPYLARWTNTARRPCCTSAGASATRSARGRCCAPGRALVEGLFAPEDIRPRDADGAELEVAAAAYAAIPFAAPAYARIDLMRDASGAPVVLELELTEPSLFLAHAPGAARRSPRHLVGATADRRPGLSRATRSRRGWRGMSTDAGFGRRLR